MTDVMLLNNVNFLELSNDDLMTIDGGAWSWKEFGRSVASGALTGAIAGATGGTMTVPVIGTVSGAVGMGIAGGVIGAVVYAATGWW
ncbi:Blp family class II bacteriocin [Petroclostridium xylanilyticum]|uniref:Blp family class II bacteriocin n=1 Tax=Petroclostridium xylanilyticum TaxID=1792311 RepID=UPI001FA8E0B9|nr:Blp family class II bacteriocin [Petroclostridium xylanilyticum]